MVAGSGLNIRGGLGSILNAATNRIKRKTAGKSSEIRQRRAVRVRQFPGIRFRVGNRLGGKGEDGGFEEDEQAVEMV